MSLCPTPGSHLTPREQEVMTFVACGATNREIARELSVTPDTVNRHIDAILRKLGVANRVAIATLYYGGTPYPTAWRGPDWY